MYPVDAVCECMFLISVCIINKCYLITVSWYDECDSDIVFCFCVCLPPNLSLITCGHYTARQILLRAVQDV